MKLLLIRHGATPGNLEKRYVGRTDESLTQESLETLGKEAKKIREELFAHRALWGSAGKKQRILIWMILHLSFSYEKIYRLYEKYLLNNRYE